MEIKLEASWKQALAAQFEQPYFQALRAFIRDEYATTRVYPPPSRLFFALDSCPLTQVRVVILGQDPYHGKGQAHGLCFSVPDGTPLPPSLQNIFKEIQSDIGAPLPSSGNLERWARQGVLLLNTTLSVREHKPLSHQGKGWEQFTDAVIRVVSQEREHVVFLLWGRHAQQKEALIDATKHLILKAAHPSPFSVSGFFGCKHFSKANEYLTQHGAEPIEW